RASVQILNTNYGTFTDDHGKFRFENLKPGKYVVNVSATGYTSINEEITAGDSKPVNVVLDASDVSLEEVVVTAQKRDELVQKLPLSISVFSSEKVKEYRLWNNKDITAIVPNLNSANPGDDRNVTSIRGITSTSYDPAVATYIDGVNQFSLDTYIAQLFDVERIEVLRGPQGTLYGRNAMGGVINIITKAPSNQANGFAELNFGNYGQQRYNVGLRAPIIKNKLFIGVSGMYRNLDGFYTNDFNNSKFDKQHSFTGNYYLKYLVSPRWMLTLNAKNNVNRNNGPFSLVNGVDEAFSNPYHLNQNATTTMVDNTFNASLSVNYTGPVLNFTSQTAWQTNYRYYKQPIDGDFSPIDGVTIINNYGNKWNNVKALTQEFRFTSPATLSSPWKWTTGIYMFYQNVPNKQATRFGDDAALLGSPDSDFSVITTSKGKNSGAAFYGQASYDINEKLELTAGLRYDYEHKEQDVLGQYQHDPDPNPAFDTRPDTSASANFSSFSPKLSASYKAAKNSIVYVTYSRGYRTGGFTQLSSDPSQPPLYKFKPEYSNNYEAGIKNTFLKNRFRVNLTFFYSTINDAQVPTLVLPDAITVTKNAGKLESKGVELEL
ncbi:MAG: TonB-dependent receptor, partial [Bacteroidota bacterium]